jgi:hypothetical protein
MAGTLEHRVTTSVRSNAGTVSSNAYTLTGDHEFNLEVEDKAIGTDTQYDVVIDVSTIESLCIEASTAMTLETNANNAAGGQTLSLLANKAIVWNTQIEATLGTVCPLTPDITALYVTNAAIGDLKIYILMNDNA